MMTPDFARLYPKIDVGEYLARAVVRHQAFDVDDRTHAIKCDSKKNVKNTFAMTRQLIDTTTARVVARPTPSAPPVTAKTRGYADQRNNHTRHSALRQALQHVTRGQRVQARADPGGQTDIEIGDAKKTTPQYRHDVRK